MPASRRKRTIYPENQKPRQRTNSPAQLLGQKLASNTTFQFGNQLWRIAYERGLLGRPRKFETAEELAQACAKYFEWLDNNPIYEAKLVSYLGESEVAQIPHRRVATLSGLCLFIGVIEQTWRNWRSQRSDLLGVIDYVEEIIQEDKYTGAIAGLYNSNIIARDLGLSDKKELTGAEGSPLIPPAQNNEKARKTRMNMIAELGGKEDE